MAEPTHDAHASARATLRCRNCGAGNRVPVARALRDLQAVRCGRCNLALLRVHGERLDGLRNEDFAHPWDREALDKLRALPMADKALSKVMGGTLDKVARFRHLAGAVRIDARQLPSLHALYQHAAHRLDMDAPPLYLVQSPQLNAAASGAGEPFVTVTSALVDALDDRELVSVFGHELAHVRLGHTLYRTLAQLIVHGGLGVVDRLFGVAGLLATPIKVALMRWYQMSELSADRGGLLAVGDLDTHLRCELKVTGGVTRFGHELSVAAFVDQARDADAARESDTLLQAMELMDGNERSHPLPAWRVHQTLLWAGEGAFLQVLAGANVQRLGREGENDGPIEAPR